MKTNNEIVDTIEETFRKAGCALTDDQQAILTGCLFIWLDKAREDKHKTRINELTSMGEFKTVGEAAEYCRIHGVNQFSVDNLFQIAGALMDARKDQDKITREQILSPPEFKSKIKPCPICGSKYFGSSVENGKRIYYCKGHHRMPQNEYSGCTYTWEEDE